MIIETDLYAGSMLLCLWWWLGSRWAAAMTCNFDGISSIMELLLTFLNTLSASICVGDSQPGKDSLWDIDNHTPLNMMAFRKRRSPKHKHKEQQSTKGREAREAIDDGMTSQRGKILREYRSSIHFPSIWYHLSPVKMRTSRAKNRPHHSNSPKPEQPLLFVLLKSEIGPPIISGVVD